MKILSALMLVIVSILISSCGDKNVSVADIQGGISHVNNITNSKNSSDVIANITHAANDIQNKLNASSTK